MHRRGHAGLDQTPEVCHQRTQIRIVNRHASSPQRHCPQRVRRGHRSSCALGHYQDGVGVSASLERDVDIVSSCGWCPEAALELAELERRPEPDHFVEPLTADDPRVDGWNRDERGLLIELRGTHARADDRRVPWRDGSPLQRHLDTSGSGHRSGADRRPPELSVSVLPCPIPPRVERAGENDATGA